MFSVMLHPLGCVSQLEHVGHPPPPIVVDDVSSSWLDENDVDE